MSIYFSVNPALGQSIGFSDHDQNQGDGNGSSSAVAAAAAAAAAAAVAISAESSSLSSGVSSSPSTSSSNSNSTSITISTNSNNPGAANVVQALIAELEYEVAQVVHQNVQLENVITGNNSNTNGTNSATISATPAPAPSSSSSSLATVSSSSVTTAVAGNTPKRSLEKSTSDSKLKRAKSSKHLSSGSTNSVVTKLESRLNSILCCAVCLDLPKSSVYQCTNGHLMCAGCFAHLLADARIRDETPTCGNCRCVISKEACSRNLAVEKAVCELPGQCPYCNQELPRSLLDKHMTDLCEERLIACRYASIGCPWNGPFHEADSHAESCSHPKKSGAQVLAFLQTQEKTAKEEKKLFDSLFNLLSFERIALNDLQFRPYRTDEYIHRLFYETARFSAFNLQWVVKARVNDDQRDPSQVVERFLSFQVTAKSKLTSPMTIHYTVIKGPFGDMKTLPKLYKHEFNEQSFETPFQRIGLISSAECNRLLASKVINFRLVMFQAPK